MSALAFCIFLVPLPRGVAGTRHRAIPGPAVPSQAGSPDCGGAIPAATSCHDGTSAALPPLGADEVEGLARRAAAAIDDPAMTIAVVDRAGRVLALYRKPSADPHNDDVAVGLARTGAYFSHDMAPLTSRTIRFISGVHFPPGVKRATNGALYGIETSNRGCDLNVAFNDGKCIPRATALNALPCNSFDQRGCGTGPVTGKPEPYDLHERGIHPPPLGLESPSNPDGLPVNPGGIPIYRVSSVRISGDFDSGKASVTATGPSSLIGGIGVAGTSPDNAEFAAFAAIALSGTSLFPAPSFPLPYPGNVFIDGIRLPFVEQSTRPQGRAVGNGDDGTFVVTPRGGGCAPNRYLVGPFATSRLTAAEVDAIVRNCVTTAWKTRAAIRLPPSSYVRMVIVVADLDGTIAALYRMPDATIFSIDVSVAKARNVVYFSSAGTTELHGLPPGTAVSNRTIGFGAQPLYPPGIDSTEPGPFFDLFLHDLANPCSQGSQPPNANQNGVVFFPGSLPLYRDGAIVAGLGVSGDGVDQDDYVTWGGAVGYRPPPSITADQVSIRDARLGFIKFPRQPEGVTEEVTEPFDEPGGVAP